MSIDNLSPDTKELRSVKKKLRLVAALMPLIFIGGLLLRPLFMHDDMALVGGGAPISEDSANKMVIDYHEWNDNWWGRHERTNSFLIRKDLLDSLSKDRTTTHYHVFFGRHNGKRTLIFAGAKNVGSEADPSFENVGYMKNSRLYYMEHVFPIDRDQCKVLNEYGNENGSIWHVKKYPDNNSDGRP